MNFLLRVQLDYFQPPVLLIIVMVFSLLRAGTKYLSMGAMFKVYYKAQLISCVPRQWGMLEIKYECVYGPGAQRL